VDLIVEFVNFDHTCLAELGKGEEKVLIELKQHFLNIY